MRVTEKPDLLLLNEPPSHWLVKQEPVGDTPPMPLLASQPKQASQPRVLTPDPAAYTAGQPRPDLAAIELTLPAPDDKERIFARPIFEPDGAITYPKREEDWEPPQNINGYVRDPNNAWRFLPLWLPCALRYQWPFSKPIAAASTSSCAAIIPRHRHSAVAWTRRLQTMPASEMNHALRRLSR